MPPPPTQSVANRLLAGLPARHHQSFLADCETVNLRAGEVLAEPGERLRQAWFPTRSSISLIAAINGHPGLEVGLIGYEGMLGINLTLGTDLSSLHAIVQGGGAALRIAAAALRQHLAASPPLRLVLQRYLHVVLAQIAQTAACTRFHTVDARLARRLLMSQDRAHSNQFHVTQEFLAAMLGVRRVGVTKAAIALQNDKLIRYSRGDITILDRDGLERSSCPCYAVDRATYAQMMK
jgi:CRP-like cAMP-binding protein